MYHEVGFSGFYIGWSLECQNSLVLFRHPGLVLKQPGFVLKQTVFFVCFFVLKEPGFVLKQP